MSSPRVTGSETVNADVEEARARAEMRAAMICIGDVFKMKTITRVWCGGVKMGEMEWNDEPSGEQNRGLLCGRGNA